MADQENQLSNQDDATQIITTLLQYYPAMAVQLAASVLPETTKAALEPIQIQDETLQIAFLKELAKEKTVEAANILQAIHTLSPGKEVRKEARRRLIQLEASDIYPTWTPEVLNTFNQALENISSSSLPAETESLLSDLETLFRQDGGASNTPGFQTTVEDFLESWHNEDFTDAYTLLSEESSLKEDLSQEDWVERRETWTRKVVPNDMQVMFFHTDDEEPVETALHPVFVDVGLSLELEKPQPLAEWPTTTISLPETGRHWYWLRYTLVQEEEGWFIQAVTDQASAITALPAEELIQRIKANDAELLEISQRVAENEIDDEDDVDGEEFIDEDGNSAVQLEPNITVIDAEVMDTTSAHTDTSSAIEEIEIVDIELEDDDDEDEDGDPDFEGVSELLDNSLDDMDAMVRLVTQSLHYYDALFAKDPAQYSQYYKDAFALARTIHDIERAIIYARQATLHTTDELSEIFLNLALSYQALAGRFHEEDDHEREEQIEDLVEPTLRQSIAIDENPNNLTALATILVINDGDIDEAEAYFVKAQKGPLTPELSVNIETGLGEIAIQNEEYAKALKHFQTLSKLVPEEPHIWYRLGYLHHQLEHFDEAIKALQQSIELDPELTEAYTELGGIYTTQGNTKRAREIVQVGLDENPEAADLYATMALIYINSGDLASANRQLIKAESLDSEDEFVQEARQRYNLENKRRPAQAKAPQKQKHNKAKKR